MINLEQIRLLESKITRAIDLIRVLKEENITLRKGLESAQRRMKELESLVDGFKTDQREIESVILRTLHTLDELEETAAGTRKQERPAGNAKPEPAAPRPPRDAVVESPTPDEAPERADTPRPDGPPPAAGEELDIF